MEHIILYVTVRATGANLQVGAYVEVQVKYKTQVRACLRSPWPITHSVLSSAPDTPAPRARLFLQSRLQTHTGSKADRFPRSVAWFSRVQAGCTRAKEGTSGDAA